MRILFWSGCLAKRRMPESVNAALKILEKLGYEVVKLGNEGCCGDPLMLAGYTQYALENAKKVAEMVNGANVDLIVTGCAGCYRGFNEYEDYGVEIPKPKHMVHIVAENLNKIKFKQTEKEKIVYHDPCELGRWSGVYEEPRKVLRSIADVVEPLLSKDEARCCGGGGGMLTIKADLSIRVGEIRIERDIEPTGVKKIVTACPACYSTLSLAAGKRWVATGRKKDERIEVFDFSQYVLSKMEV
ncbi:MAG: (Fe-S)-binding protein [Candidatus Bathyarchaeota archaeon]